MYRFGRDYYIRDAKRASGGKEDLPDEDDTTIEVSKGEDLKELEGTLTLSSFHRQLYTTNDNSTKNFVKNPLLNFPEFTL